MISKLIFFLHKWLGILTGIIIVIVSLSGCIYVFADELKEYYYKERLFIAVQEKNTLPLSVLRDKAQIALGEAYPITRSDIYPQADRSWIFRASKTKAQAIGYWNYYDYYYRVYINPYTGNILHIEDSKNEFFQLVLSLHMNLLLGEHIGSPVVGYSVALFLLIMISGVILWWPKAWTKKKIKAAFAIKWGASKKRVIYDLHNVLGFYLWVPIMILALTGLVYSFKWVDHSIQFVFNGGKTVVEREIPKSNSPQTILSFNTSLDNGLKTVLQVHPTAHMLSIRFKSDQTSPIDIQTRLKKSQTSTFAWYYFDRKTGDLLLKYGDKELKGGEKMRTMNFDLHVGSIGGMSTKILAFFASLICASLPITGFLMWYTKIQKKKKKRYKNKQKYHLIHNAESMKP